MVELINIIWLAVPLIVMVAVIIVLMYYTCMFRKSCKRIPHEGIKKYVIFFVVSFGIAFSIGILVDFWIWADTMATARYLWDRVFFPTLIASLITSWITLIAVKFLNK